MPLTDLSIRKARPQAKPYKLADGGGMYLLINTNGAKYWRLKYRVAGKEKTLAMGTYPEVSLVEAREKLLAARKLIAAGGEGAAGKSVRLAEKIKLAVGNVTQLQKIRNENLLLLEKLQQSVFDDAYSEAEEKTGLVNLSDLIIEKPRNGYSPKPVEYKTKCLSLTLSATTSGFFNASHSKFIDEEIPQDSHLWLEDGDILIQRGNTLDYVGVSAVYNGGSKTFIYPDLMMKIRPKETVLSEYLHCMLMSEQVRSYFRSNASGTSGSMPKINQKVVMNTKIPLLDEISQKTLVKVVNERLKTARKLRENINNDFSDTDTFVDSILNEAFKTVT